MQQLYLVIQGRVQLEHSNHIVKVCVKAACQHFKPWCMWKETNKLAGSFGTMPQEPWQPGIGNKLGCVIQLDCEEVGYYASCETTKAWDSFKNWGKIFSPFSDKLWLLINNSKSFPNRSNSIIGSNLGLCKHSEI